VGGALSPDFPAGENPSSRRKAAPGSKRAFTLVEVMMASLILIVGFVGMIEAVALSSSMMNHARRQTLATQIINHEIAKLRMVDWTTINALPTASTAVTIDSQFSTAIASSGATFSLARTVTNPNPVTNIREVNFTVTWVVTTSRLDSSGNRLTFTYQRSNSAWYGKYGLNLTYQRS
jgi:Tfp pilus assembly protein PilV